MYGSVFHSFQFLFSFSKPVLWPRVMLLSREGNGSPPQYSCLENPVDREAWWAAVHGVAQSCTWLKWLSMHACIGEGNGNALQYSCLEKPRDRGAWWAAVYGVAQSRTRLKWLRSSSSSSSSERRKMGEIGSQVMVIFVITVINSLETFTEWSQEMFWVLSCTFLMPSPQGRHCHYPLIQ